MAETVKKEETKEIELRVPFITNGKALAPGKHVLPVDVAEDLERRQKEFDESERRLMSNNGENIDAAPGGFNH